MSQQHVDLLGGAARTLTNVTPGTTDVTTAVLLRGCPTKNWVLHLNYEGLAGDGGDSFVPILQTSFDGGTVWWDCAAAGTMAGGVVAAVNELIHSPAGATAPARKAAADGTTASTVFVMHLLGSHVRLRGNITDADNDSQWRINKAILTRYE